MDYGGEIMTVGIEGFSSTIELAKTKQKVLDLEETIKKLTKKLKLEDKKDKDESNSNS